MKYELAKYLKLVRGGFYPSYDELADYLYDPKGVEWLKSEGYITNGDSHIILAEKGIEYLNKIEKK